MSYGLSGIWRITSSNEITPRVQDAGCFTRPQFITVGYWKTQRQLPNYLANSERRISEITAQALRDELPLDRRVGLLPDLVGVGVPVASALLSVWRPDAFTIIDYWALRTLSEFGESIGSDYFRDHKQEWWERHYDRYLMGCKSICERVGRTGLRQLDRALWKWGEINTT